MTYFPHSPNSGEERRGFTLIEVLIVLVLISLLAVTAITSIKGSIKGDTKLSALKTSLRTFRSQIQLYRLQHHDEFPTLQGNALPQMMATTDEFGNIGTGPGFVFGPYFDRVPFNPVTESTIITAADGEPPTNGTGAGGWLYYAPKGKIFADLPP